MYTPFELLIPLYSIQEASNSQLGYLFGGGINFSEGD